MEVPYRKTLRTGTVLVREHGGVLHRVTAMPDGFEWRGQTFRSLSAVARAIAGVSWSGRQFSASAVAVGAQATAVASAGRVRAPASGAPG